MFTLSKFASCVQPSATLVAAAKARQLKAAGINIYDFSVGEPDQPTPEHICRAATDAMRAGHTHYTPVSGIVEARSAVARWYERYHGYKVTPDQVVLSNGAKHSIHNTLVTTCGAGDDVIIPTPYWVSYGELVSMAGAKPVLVETTFDTQFKMTPAQLRAAITARTKLVMINSPSNPTGAVYSRRELEQLAEVVLETRVGVLSDEIYEQLCYGDARPTCFATMRPELAERTITISGASKTYAMTGWRMGWAIAPAPVAKAMGDIQSQETSCPSSISQHALIAALDGPQECVAQMRKEYEARREITCRRLKGIPGLKLNVPDGAFYAFFDVSAYFGRALAGRTVTDSLSFCAACLESAHVNLMPGSAFGCEGFVRMSYATSREQIQGGLDKLEALLTGR